MLLLGLVVIFAEAKLVQKGDVTITINGDPDKAIQTPAGGKLLGALAGSGINLPSACGGKGSCGVCICKVKSGGGDVLPTETGFISRKMAKEGERLACQVPVKENMEIEVPDEVFSINKWECEVVSNHNVATFIKEFVVKLPEGENLNFESGGYIQIEIPPYVADYKDFDIEEEYHPDWDKFNVWQFKSDVKVPCVRAYSMANHPAEGNIVMLNIRIATPPPDRNSPTGWADVPPGISSSYIFSRKPGDKVTISGPYGEFFIQETEREMVYIGGGAGMAPLRSHIFHLFHTLKTNRKVSYWYGARSKREIFYEDHFRKIEEEFPNFKFHIALSDPYLKTTGTDTPVSSITWCKMLTSTSIDAPEDIEYYLCGPPIMNTCVQDMLDSMGVEKDMIRFDDFGS